MALSADRNTPRREGNQFRGPVAASKTIYAGAGLVRDSAGNIEPATTATGKVTCGVAVENVVNSAGAAAVNVLYEAGAVYGFANSGTDPVAKTAIGDVVYWEDDQTISATATGKSAAGVLVDLDSTYAWVRIPDAPPPTVGLTAANNLSDVGTAATARANLGVATVPIGPIRISNLVGSDAKVYRIVSKVAGTIDSISSILEGHALATGNATITAAINGTPITTGVITIAQAGSAEGDIDTVSPSAAKTVAQGDAITFTVGGTNDDTAAFADVTLYVTRSA